MDETCPITIPNKNLGGWRTGRRPAWKKCGLPLAPDAKFCVKHEADRIRLSTIPERGTDA